MNQYLPVSLFLPSAYTIAGTRYGHALILLSASVGALSGNEFYIVYILYLHA